MKVNVSENLGKAEEKADNQASIIKAQQAQMQAAADAPQDKQELLDRLKSHNICLAFLILSLSSCAATSCPVPRHWTNSQQDEIEANFATLPSDSPLIGVGIEWARLRAESRACEGR